MKPLYSVITIAIVLLSIQLVNAQIFGNREPEAPTITAAHIQALQTDSRNSGRYVIVDVRDKVETDVSIIPGAITQAEFEKTKRKHRGKAVIAYCTVGYRSGIYAKKLQQNGWKAWNYKGSILDWCNHQLPVRTPSGQNTKRVHTYNSSYTLAAGYQPIY